MTDERRALPTTDEAFVLREQLAEAESLLAAEREGRQEVEEREWKRVQDAYASNAREREELRQVQARLSELQAALEEKERENQRLRDLYENAVGNRGGGRRAGAHNRRWWFVSLPGKDERIPTYTVECRENAKRLSVEDIPDPFINTRITPRGWKVALAVLLRRYEVTVIVGADRETVERVCELNPDYTGAPGSERNRRWKAELRGALESFVRELPDA